MYAQVLVDHKACWLNGPLLYRIPPDLEGCLTPGSAVEVPFGNLRRSGFVLDLVKSQSEFPEEQVRDIAALLKEERYLFDEQVELVGWMADFYGGTRAEALGCVIPAPVLQQLRKLTQGKPRKPKPPKANVDYPHKPLTPLQSQALEACWSWVEQGQTTLLQGITGSGKTEIYLHLVERTLAAGRSAIVLVPEVGLTPQAIERYRGRLGNTVAVLHSGLPSDERRTHWKRLRDGSCRVALGTRSAVFAPVQNLGLVVIDEEHDHSYKQDQAPRYHARQVAQWRCLHWKQRNLNCGIVLGSATPSLETLHTALSGRYQRFELHERASGGTLPTVQMIDLRKTRWKDRILSPQLVERLRQTVSRQEQAVLLYNRRGFANFIQCSQCGEVIQCPHCSVSLVFHRGARQLRCHYCDHTSAPRDDCPKCRAPHLELRGSGTEKVEQELHERIDGIRILRMDRDTTSRKGSHGDILGAFARHEADLLLGTQMVAKGLDFPRVTLVGVLSADAGLHLPDFRAGERTFQLLTQVAGRAGRGEVPGHVVIQAYDLDHPCLVAAQRQDFLSYSQFELEQRRQGHYPPFCRLLRIVVSGPSQSAVERCAFRIRADLEGHRGIEVVGPAPCPLERLRGQFRWHCLLKGPRVKDLADLVRTHFSSKRWPENIRVTCDPDPQSMM